MAAHPRSPRALDLPRPGRAALPFVLLCAAALAFEADPQLPWSAGVIAAAAFAGAGGLRALHARHELAVVRRSAERLIAQEPHSVETSLLARWRSAELTAPASRAALAREATRVVRLLDPASLPTASPLRRVAGRRSEDLLSQLAARLADDKPVTARGVLLARQLLQDPAGPLYSDESEHLLPHALKRVLWVLEP